MSNHQSHFDIPILFQALGIPIRMVAKKELFRIPIMGSAMHYAEVERPSISAGGAVEEPLPSTSSFTLG
jgi:1-acyl-sn-glycerol-3-phosphate acyltransferase